MTLWKRFTGLRWRWHGLIIGGVVLAVLVAITPSPEDDGSADADSTATPTTTSTTTPMMRLRQRHRSPTNQFQSAIPTISRCYL